MAGIARGSRLTIAQTMRKPVTSIAVMWCVTITAAMPSRNDTRQRDGATARVLLAHEHAGDREEAERQRERLVGELGVEEEEARVGHVHERGDAGDSRRTADPLDEQVQRQHREQPSHADHEHARLPDRQTGAHQRLGHDLEAGIERARGQDVVVREESIAREDVVERRPVVELVEEREGGRGVEDLDPVQRQPQQHDEPDALRA